MIDIVELTRGLTRCDEVAWKIFHDRYFAWLRARAVLRGAVVSDAPEVVQGVYLRVMRHAKVFVDSQSFEAWLFCLLRCELIDVARKSARRTWLGERFQQWQEARREPMKQSVALTEVLGNLDAADRLLVTRHYLDGWSQEELAAEQGMTTKAVESKLARLRRRLRGELEKLEIY
ncbi:MAG: RNA polymerase sigma factor [Luteolibacter sp.]